MRTARRFQPTQKVSESSHSIEQASLWPGRAARSDSAHCRLCGRPFSPCAATRSRRSAACDRGLLTLHSLKRRYERRRKEAKRLCHLRALPYGGQALQLLPAIPATLLRFGPGSSFLDLPNVLCEAAELRLIVKVLIMPPRQDVFAHDTQNETVQGCHRRGFRSRIFIARGENTGAFDIHAP